MGIENMQYGYNQQAFQVDPELEKISQKNWMDIQKQTEIENIKNRAQADREWQKMCYREARKENELAQHEEVIVDAKGDIYCIRGKSTDSAGIYEFTCFDNRNVRKRKVSTHDRHRGGIHKRRKDRSRP